MKPFLNQTTMVRKFLKTVQEGCQKVKLYGKMFTFASRSF